MSWTLKTRLQELKVTQIVRLSDIQRQLDQMKFNGKFSIDSPKRTDKIASRQKSTSILEDITKKN